MATSATTLVLLLVASLVIVDAQNSSVADSSMTSSGASTSPTLSSTASSTSSPSSSSTAASSSGASTTTSSSSTSTSTSSATSSTASTSTTSSTSVTSIISSPVALPSTTSSSTTTATTSSSSADTNTSSSSSSSSSQAAPTSPASSTLKATSAATVPSDVLLTFDKDPNDARVAAAVAGGCGLFLLNTVFFVVVSVLLRNTVRMERHKMPKIGRRSLTGGAVNFYGGPEVQSAQALFAPSLSATNIVSGASDIQLDAHGGRGVYVNRGFESGLGSQSMLAGDNGMQSPGYDSGYKPIEIKSSGASSSRA